MSESFEERVDRAAPRALARLEAGESVAETLHVLHEVEKIGTIGVLMVVRKLGSFGLFTARSLVEGHQAGWDVSQLRLADLRYLGEIERLGGTSGLLFYSLVDAVLRGRPSLRCESISPGAVRLYDSEDATGSGGWGGWDLSELRAAFADPKWAGHVEVVRDEPGLIILHFPRVRPREP